MANWEDYMFENTNVLKNKLGITNLDELKKAENEMVVYKLSLLYLKPISCEFDNKHLLDLHKFLFEDLYDFAGCYRDVEIFKTTGFTHPDEIEKELTLVLEKYKNMEITTNSKFEISKILGEFYRSLINIHPFREGNGRTIREFLRQFVLYKFPSYKLDYTKVDKKNFLLGILEEETYPMLLAYEIYNALVEEFVKVK